MFAEKFRIQKQLYDEELYASENIKAKQTKLIGQTSKKALRSSHAFREVLVTVLHNFIFKVLKKKSPQA